MLTRQTMRGVYAVTPTPFTAEGQLDEESLRENVHALAEAGVDAIIVGGSNGEFHTMPWEMLQRAIRALVEETPEGVMAVAGCSAVHTEEAILRTRFAMECGADAVMNVSPYYVNLTRQELLAFWRDLSSACPDIGIIIYNNPFTAQLHDLETFKALAELPNICGSKEGHYDWELYMDLLNKVDLSCMTSTELTWFVPAMKMGARGIFSMTASIFPRYVVKLYHACQEGQWAQAQAMQERLRVAWDVMIGQPCARPYNMIVRYKAFVNAAGHLKCGKNRKPLISMTDKDQALYTEVCQTQFADLISV